jgi:hypothetical protein
LATLLLRAADESPKGEALAFDALEHLCCALAIVNLQRDAVAGAEIKFDQIAL